MNIKLPPLNEQKRIVAEKKKKIRTSFEFSEATLGLLESEAERLGEPPSETLRRIIEDTHIDPEPHKTRLKNLTVHAAHVEKLERISTELNPRKGINKSAAAELLIREYFSNRGMTDNS